MTPSASRWRASRSRLASPAWDLLRDPLRTRCRRPSLEASTRRGTRSRMNTTKPPSTRNVYLQKKGEGKSFNSDAIYLTLYAQKGCRFDWELKGRQEA